MTIDDLGDKIAGGLQATAIGAALGITVGTSPMPDAARDLPVEGTHVAAMVDFSLDSREGAEGLVQAFQDGEIEEQIEEAHHGDHSEPDEDPLGDFVGEIDMWDTDDAEHDEFENMTGADVSDDDVL